MKAAIRILATAATLTALGALGLAASAHAAPPQPDPPGVQQECRAQADRIWVCNSGRGAQFDCDYDAALGSQPSLGSAASAAVGGGRLDLVRLVLLGLLVTLVAGAYWLRHHRPREVI
jgi:hypothetical protein